jgi:hypothetical protein
MCSVALGLLALIMTIATLVGREAAGSATLTPPFLSTEPCVVILALIPCGIALIAVDGRSREGLARCCVLLLTMASAADSR